jgi:hypothetical protein
MAVVFAHPVKFLAYVFFGCPWFRELPRLYNCGFYIEAVALGSSGKNIRASVPH